MIKLEKNTEKKLTTYASHFGGNYDKMINIILSYRINQLQNSIKSIQLDLTAFENKYTMKSSIFYDLFESGKLGDENSDYFQWSGEYETFLSYQEELKHLL